MVDRDMIELATSIRLLTGLVVLVYGYTVVLGERPHARKLLIAVVGLIPFFVWVLAPTLLETGRIALTIDVRRYSPLAGAAAVALRYVSVRGGNHPDRKRHALAVASGVALLATIAVASANWLVCGAALVSVIAATSMAASNRITASGESSDEDPSPHAPPQGQ